MQSDCCTYGAVCHSSSTWYTGEDQGTRLRSEHGQKNCCRGINREISDLAAVESQGEELFRRFALHHTGQGSELLLIQSIVLGVAKERQHCNTNLHGLVLLGIIAISLNHYSIINRHNFFVI